MGADASLESGVLSSLSLRILATSDLHANLHPYNYYTDQPQNRGGLVRAGGVIASLRRAAENCLLVDNGDTLQGTPLGDFAAQSQCANGRPHPMVAAMNALNYDAMALGNHDFNYGLEFLQAALAGASFPAVLANIKRVDGESFVPPWVILDRDMQDMSGRSRRLRIGVIGFAPPQTLMWDRYLLEGKLEAEDILTAARREIRAVREAGADLVILLSHSGLGPTEEHPQMENAVVPLAQLDGVDAVIAGHTHELFPAPHNAAPDWLDPDAGTIHGTPVVQPGAEGSHLGVIDLTLSEIDRDCWRVSNATGQLIRIAPPTAAAASTCKVPEIESCPDVIRATAEDHIATLGFIRRRVGETLVPLETYFALLANSAAVQVIADAQRDFAGQILRGHKLAHLPLLSAAAPFKAGGRGGPVNYTDIPKGPLAIKNAADLYVYPNMVAILKATGAQVRDWLERAACAFHQIRPDEPQQPLIDHRFAGYNFDVLDGLTYAIDVTVPARYSADGEEEYETPGRIRDLRHNGQLVTEDQEFLVVTNSYRASGGGHFKAPADAEQIWLERLSVRDVLVRYFTTYDRLSAVTNPTWRFADASGIRAIAEIGPGALAYPDRIKEFGLEYLGAAETGFARFAMTL